MFTKSDQIAAQVGDLLRQGKAQRALTLIGHGLAAEPSNLNLTIRMVHVLLRTGPVDKLLYYAGRCLILAPDDARAAYTHAFCLAALERNAEAIAACEKFFKRRSKDPNLAMLREVYLSCCGKLRRFDDVLDMAALLPGNLSDTPEVALQVYRAFMATGQAQQGLAGFAELARRSPGNPVFVGDWCSASTYSCTHSAQEIFEIHRFYGDAVDAMKRASPPAPPAHTPLPAAGRKVRIGFVSSDLNDHSVSFFLEPLLAGLSRELFETTVFQLGRSDHATQRLFEAMGAEPQRWVNLNNLDMEDLATQIRERQIDLLIELGGHTAGNVLLAMARNPAPLIATWCGYPHTTGLGDINFRFVDSNTDPAGFESQATERLIRLDPCFLCYKPGAELLATTPAPPPCLANGFITFGSFNAITKFNPVTASLWAGAMHAVPNSRLLLKAPAFTSQRTATKIKAEVANYGIDPARIETVAFLPSRQAALALYNRVDIAFDPFPYHGTTTTCEALAMGVPVISLIGDRHAARVGLSLLSAAGLPKLAVYSPEAFTAQAAQLASDFAALTSLRARLRNQLLASKLCDAQAFAARFGDAAINLVNEAAAHASI